MLTGLLRDILIRHFSTPLNIEEPDMRHLLWREDERTGILIESIHRWRGDLIEKRPAIIVKLNARQNIRKAIGDISRITEQGHTLYETFWVGSHTLFCIHGSGAGAEILATEVEREITEFSPPLRQRLNLADLHVTEVGTTAEIEEARESFVVPITVGWIYSQQWLVKLESRTLGRVDIRALFGGALVI